MQKKRVLPGGSEVSDNIYRRIESLGLHSEIQDSKNQPQGQRDLSQKQLQVPELNEYDDSYHNAVTYIASDSEGDVTSDGVQRFSPKNFEKRTFVPSSKPSISDHTNFNNLFGGQTEAQDGDTSSEEEFRTSPQYAVWLSPPKLEPFVDPVALGNDEGDETDLTLEVGSHQVKNQEQSGRRIAKAADVKESAISMSEDPNNLKSIAEQERLMNYLKRIEAEEQKKNREKEVKATSNIPLLRNADPKSPLPRRTRPRSIDTISISPASLNLSEVDLDAEELVFTPVHIEWKGDKASGSLQPENQQLKPNYDLNREKATSPRAGGSGAHLPIQRGVQFSKSNIETSIDDSTESQDDAFTPARLSATMENRSRIRRSRSLPFASVSKLQRSLSKGFREIQSRKMTFIVKGSMKTALDVVASACQHHLKLAVYKRHSGDKLRVESIHQRGDRLRISLKFRELTGAQPTTSVDVRPSRLDRDKSNLSRVWEFFTMLVTQLDIGGHIAGVK